MNIKSEDECPCGSGKTFGDCCAPLLAGERMGETAEEVMRARYSAYVSEQVDFLRRSSTAEVQAEYSEESSLAWARAAHWHGLEIISTEKGGPGDSKGVVEFRATYTANGEFCNHHEVSQFVRGENGAWLFRDGELVRDRPIVRDQPKINRNAPCPCGSGRKYKKCCGRDQ